MVVRGTLKMSAICWTVPLASLVELLREGDLLWVELRAPAALAAAGAGCGEPVARVSDDELALELGEDGEHPEHGAAFCGGGVDALLDDVQADAAFAQLGAEGDEVQDRSAEAVQSRDFQRVAVAQEPQDVVELRAAGLGAAGVVDVDVVIGDAGAAQRVDLVAGILVGRRDAGVAEEHGVENT
jgi:hypothetical protein